MVSDNAIKLYRPVPLLIASNIRWLAGERIVKFYPNLSNSPNSICYWCVDLLQWVRPSHSFIPSPFKFYTMEEFLLIMRHEDGGKVASAEQMQAWMKQTMDWIGGIAAQNKFVSGTGLPFDDSRVVWHNNVVTNGPFGEIKETIGGYITVKADSFYKYCTDWFYTKLACFVIRNVVLVHLPGLNYPSLIKI